MEMAVQSVSAMKPGQLLSFKAVKYETNDLDLMVS